MAKRWLLVAASAVALALAGCQDELASGSNRHLSPIPPATLSLMTTKGMSKMDPILIRAYKKEAEMEVWKRGQDGRYALLKTFPICRWSGQLGPKVKEGDRQAPEGFYTVNPAQMNPNSAYYLSFDTGFPNAYDKAHGRTGGALMVHGTCSSRGCFAMTDTAIAEVYSIAREAFGGGQRAFQFQSYPFRMTAENMAKLRNDPNMPFWKNLKEGADYFEVTKEEPRIAVCGGRYVFGGAEVGQGNCSPRVEPAVAEKSRNDDQKVAELVTSGTPAVKVVYEDGGGNAAFHQAMVTAAGGSETSTFAVLDTRPRNLGTVSRPEALAAGPREIALAEPVAKTKPGQKPSTALAFAAAEKAGGKGSVLVASKMSAPGAKPATDGSARSGGSTSPQRVEVASAGDSPSLYGKVLGKGPGKPELKATASEPAPKADPATTASHKPATPAKAQTETFSKLDLGSSTTKAQARMPAEKSALKTASPAKVRAERQTDAAALRGTTTQ